MLFFGEVAVPLAQRPFVGAAEVAPPAADPHCPSTPEVTGDL
jgi:hypothetical protein